MFATNCTAPREKFLDGDLGASDFVVAHKISVATGHSSAPGGICCGFCAGRTKGARRSRSLASRAALFRVFYLGNADLHTARGHLGISELTWEQWSDDVRMPRGTARFFIAEYFRLRDYFKDSTRCGEGEAGNRPRSRRKSAQQQTGLPIGDLRSRGLLGVLRTRPQLVHCAGERDQLRNSRRAARPPQKDFSQRGQGHVAIRFSKFTTEIIQVIHNIAASAKCIGVNTFIAGNSGFRNIAATIPRNPPVARNIMFRRSLLKFCHSRMKFVMRPSPVLGGVQGVSAFDAARTAFPPSHVEVVSRRFLERRTNRLANMRLVVIANNLKYHLTIFSILVK